jgi:hypothetical protein
MHRYQNRAHCRRHVVASVARAKQGSAATQRPRRNGIAADWRQTFATSRYEQSAAPSRPRLRGGPGPSSVEYRLGGC